jgi:hypothetical protein
MNLFGEPLDSDTVTEARVFGPAPGPTCGWRPPRAREDLQPCVRYAEHKGKHVVWRAGRVDLVVWQVGEDGGGVELFRGRVCGMKGRGMTELTPVDVRSMYEAATGLARELKRA